MLIIDRQIAENNLLPATLLEMKRLEDISVSNPSFIQFVKDTFPLTAISLRIYLFLRNQCQYVPDSPFDEILIAPHIFMNYRKGDCDDFSMFTRAVLKVQNRNSQYILLGKNNEDFSHVAVYHNNTIIDGCNKKYNNIPALYTKKQLVDL